ncbi:transglycosylase SLT domain-containing protein [Mongoliitalea daihaiensis]|uniref:transglycosylase SLT domain-containing protein n=1 Tax=Mongoliitalea daihaiensis TaxID=2782006 RepID=UPI001F2378B8|nr:transglycosylase SLT domain-containing protein [Mongoliitalea daihaiensis]UJP63995.1 transglycosylase SLT domain-containing protein [Mongoliitalea daihaiensis]
MKIPESIYKKAAEKDTLEWLYQNAARFEQKYNLPKGILLPLAGHESMNYQRTVNSGTGPRGLFQISRDTAKGLGLRVDDEVDERTDLEKATDAAARLIRENLDRNKGDVVRALAEYNGGLDASKFVDRPYDFDPKNGNPGELYGFMRGVRNYAREWGNTELSDLIDNVYTPAKQAVIDRQNLMIKNGIEVKADGNWDRDQYQKWQKLVEQKPEILNPQQPAQMPPSPIAPYLPKESQVIYEKPPVPPRMPQQPSKPAAQAEPNPAQPSAPSSKRDPREIRIHEEGGKLVQLEGSGEGNEVDLQGEERIYSIKDTEKIVQLAMKAESPEDLYKLGEYVYKATLKQDATPPEYTDS